MFNFEDETKINFSNHHWDNDLLDGWFSCESGYSNIRQYMVPDFKKTFFYPSKFAFCSCLDTTLPTYGNCGRKGMVLWNPPTPGQNSDIHLWTTTLSQWTLVVRFLWVEESDRGIGVDRGIIFFDY